MKTHHRVGTNFWVLGNTAQLNGVYKFILFAFTYFSSRSSRLEKLLIVVGVTEASARLTTWWSMRGATSPASISAMDAGNGSAVRRRWRITGENREFSSIFYQLNIFVVGCFAPRWLPSPRPRRRKRLPDWSPSALCTKCLRKEQLLEQQQIHSGDSLCQMKL